MKNTMFNMVAALGIITLVTGSLLAMIYSLTKEPIEAAQKQKLQEAILVVSPKFDNDPVTESYEITQKNDESFIAYPIKLAGQKVGAAFKVYTDEGFSKRIYVLVGLTTDNTIVGTSVLQHSETPGLGDKIDKKISNWTNQFNGKNPSSYKLKVKKDGGDVDGITAATITSRAYIDAINKGINANTNVK